MAGTINSAHDALLAVMPEGASHDDCPICLAAAAEQAKEGADVSDATERTFSEAEHFALLTDAVRRETAELSEAKTALETEKAELQQRVDVLEAEKAALTTERDTIKQEFEDFKAELAEKAAVEARTQERLDAVKAAADHLPDEYFTPERAARWAAMSDEAFETAVADLSATKPAAGTSVPAPETAAFSGGESPTHTNSEGTAVNRFFALSRGKK